MASRRFFLAYAFILFGLIAVAAWLRPIGTTNRSAPLRAAEPNDAISQPASTRGPTIARTSETASAGSPAATPLLVVAEPTVTTACAACRDRECRNFNETGVDIVAGCLKSIDADYGADPRDADFVADCQAVVQCAIASGCASTPLGPVDCYCGSTPVDDCLEHGPAFDAPCVEQWRRATRSADTKKIAERFSDLKYPAGWGSLLIRCDREICKDQCNS